MALPIVSLMAVPFTLGNNTIAARRQNRRSNTGASSSAPLSNLDDQKKAIIMMIVNEAAKEIQSVIDLDSETTSRQSIEIPAQPPNSPNEGDLTFEFPATGVNQEDGLPAPRPLSSRDLDSTSEEDEIFTEKPKRSRSFRKRRRVPSFKTGATPRVPSKVTCSSSEADDESSESEISNQKYNIKVDTDNDNKKELELRLGLLSETRKTLAETEDRVEEWARVGTELRYIADTFQRGVDSTDGGSDEAFDIFSLINEMLPVSIPQSLWSALVSYAAWKIFKRFQ